ncbi:hypothetical protein [Marinobacter fonticola]|uniref:hypothetical protein n=1 Tax=Marinobacter fonticola TaxID=2603215 RepID=UPI0011E751E3|nr:hypothetical protein [Marinobacter fonticola]
MIWIKAFVAGVLATLIFHQGVFGLFHMIGLVPAEPYNISPVPPFGVPAVLSLAFFGGLWGPPIWALIRGLSPLLHWIMAFVLGAIGPTVVAMLVVFPLKGLDVSAQTWIGGLILNGCWGLGLAVFMKLMVVRKNS